MDKYPIVEYSHMIGKNTADFTVTDLVKFTKWWVSLEIKEENKMSQKNVEQGDEVVAELGLTQVDIDGLKWGLKTLLEGYDFSEMPEVEVSLTGILEAINGGA